MKTKTPKKVVRAAEANRRKWEKVLTIAQDGGRLRGNRTRFVAVEDATSFVKLSRLLETNRITQALDFYEGLDSFTRDNLPVVVVNYLERVMS